MSFGSRQLARPAALLALLACCVLCGGCATGDPPPISSRELAQAETFPYFTIYWVGRNFSGHPLTAADAQKTYNSRIGDSVYYGNCVKGEGILGTGSCRLPLRVTSVIYSLHSNQALGSQRNAVIRGVPATIYEGGRAIELYTGQLAIDIFSDTEAHALLAASSLRPLNASGTPGTPLPLPVYCPGLWGAMPAPLSVLMNHLPGHACQQAQTAAAANRS